MQRNETMLVGGARDNDTVMVHVYDVNCQFTIDPTISKDLLASCEFHIFIHFYLIGEAQLRPGSPFQYIHTVGHLAVTKTFITAPQTK
jgi:hypothetical protein